MTAQEVLDKHASDFVMADVNVYDGPLQPIIDAMYEYANRDRGNEWVDLKLQKPTSHKVSFKDLHGNVFRGNYSKTSNDFYAYGFNEPILNITHWKLQEPKKSI